MASYNVILSDWSIPFYFHFSESVHAVACIHATAKIWFKKKIWNLEWQQCNHYSFQVVFKFPLTTGWSRSTWNCRAARRRRKSSTYFSQYKLACAALLHTFGFTRSIISDRFSIIYRVWMEMTVRKAKQDHLENRYKFSIASEIQNRCQLSLHSLAYIFDITMVWQWIKWYFNSYKYSLNELCHPESSNIYIVGSNFQLL